MSYDKMDRHQTMTPNLILLNFLKGNYRLWMPLPFIS